MQTGENPAGRLLKNERTFRLGLRACIAHQSEVLGTTDFGRRAAGGPDRWFKKDPVFDDTVREAFRIVHGALAKSDKSLFLADARTALSAVIVLDQMSRNMFRATPSAFAADVQAIVREAIAQGLDVGLTKDERTFLYLPFEHAEDAEAQARCVASMATLDDLELTKWADARQRIIDRFGPLPASQRGT